MDINLQRNSLMIGDCVSQTFFGKPSADYYIDDKSIYLKTNKILLNLIKQNFIKKFSLKKMIL